MPVYWSRRLEEEIKERKKSPTLLTLKIARVILVLGGSVSVVWRMVGPLLFENLYKRGWLTSIYSKDRRK